MSIQCLPSDLTEQELIEHCERQPEQCEQDMMDEFQCWEEEREEIIAMVQDSEQWNDQMNADHRDDMIAIVQESDRWSRQIGAMMEKWNQLNASRDESSTDENFHDAPESSPTLPVEKTESTINPFSNPY